MAILNLKKNQTGGSNAPKPDTLPLPTLPLIRGATLTCLSRQ